MGEGKERSREIERETKRTEVLRVRMVKNRKDGKRETKRKREEERKESEEREK